LWRRSRWNADLLKEHYDAVFADQAQDTARTAATMEQRLNSHNDLLGRFVTRAELQASEARQRATVVAVAAVVSAVAGAIALFR
jgi:hypothetical protein